MAVHRPHWIRRIIHRRQTDRNAGQIEKFPKKTTTSLGTSIDEFQEKPAFTNALGAVEEEDEYPRPATPEFGPAVLYRPPVITQPRHYVHSEVLGAHKMDRYSRLPTSTQLAAVTGSLASTGVGSVPLTPGESISYFAAPRGAYGYCPRQGSCQRPVSLGSSAMWPLLATDPLCSPGDGSWPCSLCSDSYSIASTYVGSSWGSSDYGSGCGGGCGGD